MFLIYFLNYLFAFCISGLIVCGIYNIFYEILEIKNNVIRFLLLPILLIFTLWIGYYIPNIFITLKTKTEYQKNLIWEKKGYQCIEGNLFLKENEYIDLKKSCDFNIEKGIIDYMYDIINKRKK